MSSDYSSENIRTRRQWNDIIKGLKGNKTKHTKHGNPELSIPTESDLSVRKVK